MIAMPLCRYALSVCAAGAILAGCAGGVAPLGSPQVARQSAIPHGDLLYVTGGCGGTCVLSYPKGKVVASISQAGVGLCSDAKGNVFMPSASSGAAVVYEFAHGGTTPVATLDLPSGALVAEGCAVDPKTNDLAVSYICADCSDGPVAIFKDERGTPASYDQPGVYLSFCGYDAKGDLFADGTNLSNDFALTEFAHGKTGFNELSVSQAIHNAGQVQWDGAYVAVEDLDQPVIYQFKVSGSTAKLKGTTRLSGSGTWGGQAWIDGASVIVPFAESGSNPSEVGFWKYPSGGSATKILKKGLDANVLSGATISVGK
ncbi:MAG TPA: hypothetical protein VMU38_11025 [Candidatus Binatia bacterium]|nr:hypothetical protein [Candidatus Binatia bacterium]